LGKVVHQFPKPGYYLGTVLREDQAVARFHLKVDPANNLPQTNVDLASLVQGPGVPCPNCPPGSNEAEFTVNPKGHVLFYVSKGPDGFAVTVADGFTPQAMTVFDSRQLQAGDYFIAQMLQPGHYKATNLINQQVHTLEVGHPPAPAQKAYVPPAPLLLQSHAEGFSLNSVPLKAVKIPQKAKSPAPGAADEGAPSTGPAHVQVAALQPKVYQIMAPSRIHIELTTPAPRPQKI